MMLAEEVTGESPKHIQASRQTVPVIPQTSTFREQGETSNRSASNAFSIIHNAKKAFRIYQTVSVSQYHQAVLERIHVANTPLKYYIK